MTRIRHHADASLRRCWLSVFPSWWNRPWPGSSISTILGRRPSTRGLPAYITSTNTFVAGEGTPPAQNYPQGWLTAALDEVNRQPQVHALCWFLDVDRSGDARWDWFSLAERQGRLVYAAEEFDALLRQR